jgi:glycogen operon protein
MAYCLRGASLNDDDIYVMVNAGTNETVFRIQEGTGWMLVADTSLSTPADFVQAEQRKPANSDLYRVEGRSVVVLQREGEQHLQ